MLKQFSSAIFMIILATLVHSSPARNGLKSRNTPHFQNIVGGRPVERHSMPFIVAITMYDPESRQNYICAGTLISDRHILTAGHCVYKKAVVKLQFGAHDRFIAEGEQTIIEGSLPYTMHPDYNPQTLNHDLAIVIIDPLRVPNAQHVKIANLPDQKYGSNQYADYRAKAFGWGHTNDNPNDFPRELISVDVTVLKLETCLSELLKVIYPKTFALYYTDICTNGNGRLGATGTCKGDSGGPLMIDSTVIGVVSRGASGVCTSREPSVYACVSQHLDWIRQVLGQP